jgi:hypothetical protein
MDTLPGCLHTHTLAFIDGVEDGMKVRDRLLGKQGVTELPLAWYRSAVEADQTGVPGIDAALTKAFACPWHKISPTLPEDICKLRA